MISAKFLKRATSWMFGTKSLQTSEQNGERIWNELDALLPPAVGIIEDDLPRIEAFKRQVQKLGRRDKNDLKSWLVLQIYDLEHNFCELSTSSEEELERQWKQIYNQHLKAIS